MDFKKFLKVLGIEIIILIIANPIVNKYFIFNTFTNAGSWGIFAPLPLFEKLYSNSQFLRSGFNFTYFLIDLVIIIGIAILFSLIKSKKN